MKFMNRFTNLLVQIIHFKSTIFLSDVFILFNLTIYPHVSIISVTKTEFNRSRCCCLAFELIMFVVNKNL